MSSCRSNSALDSDINRRGQALQPNTQIGHSDLKIQITLTLANTYPPWQDLSTSLPDPHLPKSIQYMMRSLAWSLVLSSTRLKYSSFPSLHGILGLHGYPRLPLITAMVAYVPCDRTAHWSQDALPKGSQHCKTFDVNRPMPGVMSMGLRLKQSHPYCWTWSH